MVENLRAHFVPDEGADNLILVDCDGTFNDHALVRDFVDALKQDGTWRVLLISNESDANQAGIKIWGLRRHRDADYYGEVLPKSEYSGKAVFSVLDDDHTSHNIRARVRLHPSNDRRVLEMLTEGLKKGPEITILNENVRLKDLLAKSRIETPLSPKQS